MNREILFRSKRLDNGEWVYGYLVKRPTAVQVGDCSPWYISVPPVDPDDSGGLYNVNPSTVGQYTGQVDYETEAKIFCGDILEAQSGPYGKFAVDFGDGGYFIREIGGTGAGLPLSVENIAWLMLVKIGNLHDNPELMEDTDDG